MSGGLLGVRGVYWRDLMARGGLLRADGPWRPGHGERGRGVVGALVLVTSGCLLGLGVHGRCQWGEGEW